MTDHEKQSEPSALSYLEASSRLCLYSLAGLGREAEALASQAHSLLLEAQLEEREPYVTARLRASDARLAALALEPDPGGFADPESEALTRVRSALRSAGWKPGVHAPGRRLTVEQLAEAESEGLTREQLEEAEQLSKPGRLVPAEQPSPASESFELLARERAAYAYLTSEQGPEGEAELPDDFVMTFSEVVSHAVDALAGRLEELYVNSVAVSEGEGPSWEGWRRVAAAAFADNLEPALGGLPLAIDDADREAERREGEGQ